ncbi:MAG: hypothetical protein U0527_06290 [Candidatus Eisenbacteria bacterium]
MKHESPHHRCGWSAVLGLLLTGLAASPAAATGECGGPEPSAVLSCLESAYLSRGFAAYQALLAADFQMVVFADTVQVDAWDREKELKSTRGLFQDVKIRSVKLRFDRKGLETESQGENRWVLNRVASHLTIESKIDGEVRRVDVDVPMNRIFVRKVEGGHWEIYRWEDHEKAE